MKPSKKLIFYTKPDCPLCEKALRVIISVQKQIDFELEITDITQNESLFERFCFDIPVGLLDGATLFRGRVSEDELWAALR